MIAAGIATEDQLNQIRAGAEADVENAIEYAQTCSDVSAEDYLAYITAEE